MKVGGKQKIFFILSLAAVIGAGYFLIKPHVVKPEGSSRNQNLAAEEQPAGQKQIELLFAGDIMLDRNVKAKIQSVGGGDFSFPFQKIADVIKSADIAFANLEGPLSDKGTKVGSIYSFRMDPASAPALAAAGFDVLSVANNHAMDYGNAALKDTFERLQAAGIDYVGGGFNATDASTPVIKEVDGTKFAFLAYTNLCPLSWRPTENYAGINCISANDLAEVKSQVAAAKKSADIVIVSLHSGIEYSQTVTSFQQDFAHSAIDAGADLVIGHHPHVVQKSEQYKGKWIFYSLGNFVFDQSFSTSTMQGEMVKVLVQDKKIQEVIPIKTRLNANFQVEVASSSTQPEVKSAETSEIAAPTSPALSLSSAVPLQGDTVLINVKNVEDAQNVTGEFGTTKINFFESQDGVFGLLGIGADKTPGTYRLTVTLPDKTELAKNITVIKRIYPVTVLGFTPQLEEKGYNATSVDQNTFTDNTKLYAAMSAPAPQALFDKSFAYPLDKIIDVGAFGNIRQSGSTSLQHLGVDLQAAMDSNVYAVNDGVVTGTLNLVDYGNTIVIDHGAGIFSLYLHLDKFKVSSGQKVTRGQLIGLSGDTGYALAPHLHFSIKLNGASVDPLKFIQTAQF